MKKSIEFDHVADIYDYYVTTDLDLQFYLQEFQEREEVLELMCGTGRVSIPLIENGIPLTCVDYSSKMLAKLREKLKCNGLQADLLDADIRFLEVGKKFDAIFIPFNSFMELVGEENQMAAMARIYSHLSPEGVFICTLHNPAQRIKAVNGEMVFRGEFQLPENKKLLLFSLETYNPTSKIIEGIQFFKFYDEQGTLELERQLDIQFSLIEQKPFEQMISKAGFKVLKLFGDYNKGLFNHESSPFMIYILAPK